MRYVNVFYSNGSVYANEAWMITRQLGYENNFVLEGGLNYWFGNILSPRHLHRPVRMRNSQSTISARALLLLLAAAVLFQLRAPAPDSEGSQARCDGKGQEEACGRLLIFWSKQKKVYICGCKTRGPIVQWIERGFPKPEI